MAKLPLVLVEGPGMDGHESRSELVGDPAPDSERAEQRDELGDRGAARRKMRIGDVLQIDRIQLGREEMGD